MDNLADDYFVSRSTLERDLKAIKREVSKFGLSVSSTVNGIAIKKLSAIGIRFDTL